MILLRNNLIYFIIFLTGAAILIIELAAIRILSPYFGNTLYSVSSVISVVLAALSLGYYGGGYLADRYPKVFLFYFLIFIGGIFSFSIQIFSKFFLPLLESFLDLKSGPLVSSIFMFFAPCLILGTLSPFAVRLKASKTEEIGGVAGRVFFWSTLGSIVGSLLAGFLLIPNFGVTKIIISTSLFLVILGLLGMLLVKIKEGNNYRLLIFFLLLIPILLISLNLYIPSSSGSVIFEKDGVYSRLVIEKIKIDNQDVLVLRHDRSYQSGIFLDSEELPFEYTKFYRLYQVINPEAEKVLFLGGGAYTIPNKILSEDNKIRKVDVVEIEPELYSLAKKYFRLKDDSRLSNHLTDGRVFLRKTREKYDIIFADAYSSTYSIPAHLTTKEFFTLAKEKLSNNGFFWANIIGKLEGEGGQFLLSEIKTFKSVFKNSYLFFASPPGYKGLRNFILIGIKDENKKFDFSKMGFSSEIDISKLNLDSALILTDDFAPVEYLTAKSL